MGANATCLMLESASQPDAFLRVREAFGGRSRALKDRLFGAPELTVEICASSTEVDFWPEVGALPESRCAGVSHAGIDDEACTVAITGRQSYRLIEPDARRCIAFNGLPRFVA